VEVGLIFVCNHNAQAINQKYEIDIFINGYDIGPIISDYLPMVVVANFSSMQIKVFING
jgi:hypothetical protein